MPISSHLLCHFRSISTKLYSFGRGCMLFNPCCSDDFRKINMPLNNIIPLKVSGSWEHDPAERTAKCCRPNEPEPGNTGGGKNKCTKQTIQIENRFSQPRY